jgi:hypothetical protein
MANTNAIGLQPFADAGGVDSVEDPLPEEYAVAVSALPSNPCCAATGHVGAGAVGARDHVIRHQYFGYNHFFH